MRCRNKKWAKGFIEKHKYLVYDKELIDNRHKTLEVGIGKGSFIIANAQYNPDILHIGVEMNMSIYAMAMKKIVITGLENIRLLNINANTLSNYIDNDSVDIIYLNFPDPWPRKGDFKKRLVHTTFLDIFEKLLVNNGQIRIKTDNKQLFDMGIQNFSERQYTLECVDYDYKHADDDFITEYEIRFREQQCPIYRAVARINKPL